MKKTSRNISLLLVLLMIFNTFGFSFADASSNNVNVKINRKSDDGTTKVEEGVITLNVNNEILDIEYSDTFRGNKKVTKLKYGDTIEIIENDLESDIFAITKNGVKKEFNKNDAIKRIKTVMDIKVATATLSSVSSYLGTPYMDRLLASKSLRL